MKITSKIFRIISVAMLLLIDPRESTASLPNTLTHELLRLLNEINFTTTQKRQNYSMNVLNPFTPEQRTEAITRSSYLLMAHVFHICLC